MELHNTIYWISGYIPEGEIEPSMEVKKLVQLGNFKKYKYVWIAVDHNGGIGTAQELNNIGLETIQEALLQPYGFMDPAENNMVKAMPFNEMITKYNILKEKLFKEVNETKTI